jgi:hypothetical protein
VEGVSTGWMAAKHDRRIFEAIERNGHGFGTYLKASGRKAAPRGSLANYLFRTRRPELFGWCAGLDLNN